MMGRRVGLAIAAVAAAVAATLGATGSAAGDPGTEKARVDREIGRLRDRAASAEQQAGVLTEELIAVAGRVRELEAGVDAQQARLGVREGRLAQARARLATLDRRLEQQTARLERLRGEYRIALARLEERVRYLYMTDGPDVLSFVVGTSSFTDILDNLELLSRIGRQEKEIAAEVRAARDGVAEARRQTRAARADQARVEAVVASATTEQRGVATRLAARRDALAAAQREKSSALASIEANQSQIHEEIEDLEAESAALAEQIRQAQQPSSSGSTSTPPVVPIGNGTLGWPVSGPVVSGFGMRWGRMHEGIDITCSTGTPVRAAGNGTVIWASWRGGYGNAVVIDHGGGLATLYAHNSAFATSVGQTVVRGQVIAYAGSTGNSSGPHVHFEVRVNGTAVDPLGYL